MVKPKQTRHPLNQSQLHYLFTSLSSDTLKQTDKQWPLVDTRHVIQQGEVVDTITIKDGLKLRVDWATSWIEPFSWETNNLPTSCSTTFTVVVEDTSILRAGVLCLLLLACTHAMWTKPVWWREVPPDHTEPGRTADPTTNDTLMYESLIFRAVSQRAGASLCEQRSAHRPFMKDHWSRWQWILSWLAGYCGSGKGH